MSRVPRLVPKSGHRIPLASTTRTPWPEKKKHSIISWSVKRRVIHSLLPSPNPSLRPSRCSSAGSLHGAAVWGGYPVLYRHQLTELRSLLVRNGRTKPEGTVTLARPIFSSTVRATPVGGSRSAFSSAGHTMPFHWPCNIGALGMYVSARASSASSRTRSPSRTAWASAGVITSSN